MARLKRREVPPAPVLDTVDLSSYEAEVYVAQAGRRERVATAWHGATLDRIAYDAENSALTIHASGLAATIATAPSAAITQLLVMADLERVRVHCSVRDGVTRVHFVSATWGYALALSTLSDPFTY